MLITKTWCYIVNGKSECFYRNLKKKIERKPFCNSNQCCIFYTIMHRKYFIHHQPKSDFKVENRNFSGET